MHFKRSLLCASLLVGISAASVDAATLLYQYNFNSASPGVPSGGVGTGGALSTFGTAPPTFTAPGVSGNAGDFALSNTATGYNGNGYAAGTIGPGATTGNQLTITTWLRAPGGLSSLGGNFSRLVQINNPAGSDGNVFSLQLNNVVANPATIPPTDAATRLQTNVNNVNPNYQSSGPNSFSGGNFSSNIGTDSEWYFVAVTYNGTVASQNLNFYRGTTSGPATLLSTGNVVTGAPAAAPPIGPAAGDISGYEITLAGRPTGARQFPGYLDDVRIYSGVLTASELEAVRLEALPAVVPEPTSLAVVALGAAALLRRRKA